MGKQPPAFQFYGRDFDASTKSWDLAAVGAYTRLLIHQWECGGVPDDIREICRVVGAFPDELEPIWESRLREKFPLCEDGKRRNPRLERIRQEQRDYREKKARAGRLGAKKRWHDDSTASSTGNSSVNSGANDTPNGKPMALQSPTPTTTATDTPTPKEDSCESVGQETDREPRWKAEHDYAADWNTLAEEFGWTQLRSITNKRRTKIKTRESEAAWDWPAILKQLELVRPDWWKNFPGWSFDWLIRNDTNYVKVLEGKFSRRADENPMHCRECGRKNESGKGWDKDGPYGGGLCGPCIWSKPTPHGFVHPDSGWVWDQQREDYVAPDEFEGHA